MRRKNPLLAIESPLPEAHSMLRLLATLSSFQRLKQRPRTG
jgi:hypothetical protein